MIKDKHDSTIKLLNTAHFLLNVFAFLLVFTRSIELGHSEYRYYFYVTLLYGILLYLLNSTYNAYLVGFTSAGDMAYSQSLSCTLSIMGIYAATALAWTRFYDPIPFLLLLIGQVICNILWSKLITRIYFKLIPPRKTAVLYRTHEDLLRIEEIKENPRKFRLSAFLPEEKLGNDFKAVLEGYEALFVIGIDASLRNRIAQYCVENGIQGYFLPDVGDVILAGARHIQSYSVPVLNVERKRPVPEFLAVKRAFDIVASLIGLILTSPFMLLTALAVKLYDGGPVFYTQTRLTKDSKVFKMIKFRSMRTDAEKDGVARLTTENDDRITPVGKVIRAIRMDEMPQLINILKGEMSIVGPRPERPEIAEQYSKEFPAFRLRLQVKAGLTGYAQVYGRYNTDPHDKLEMDLMYINKMGIFTDLMLIFGTLRILFVKESTSGVQAGHITASLTEGEDGTEK